MKTALLLVDLQNDFMPGGALPVPGGDEVIILANKLQAYFDVVIATQDWHPAHHMSFAVNHPHHQPGDWVSCPGGSEQFLWPIHCVQHTRGAELVAPLHQELIEKVIYKGTDPSVDSYSAFFDNARLKETPLAEYLQQQAIDQLYVMGVALEYCVQYTVLDACSLGLNTYLITDGCRGLDQESQQTAIATMHAAGAHHLLSTAIFEKFSPK